MLSRLATTLATIPIVEWHVDNVIIFDWYDGPLEGICILDQPDCLFYFRCVGERSCSDRPNDRLFEIREILDTSSSDIGLWRRAAEPNSDRTEGATDEWKALVSRLGEPVLLVRTENMLRFDTYRQYLPPGFT